jgi:phage terminase Nu1 subunit (DNA packaging protein)
MGEEPPLPYVEGGGKGKPWVYDSAACIEWWAENKYRRKQRGPAPGADPFAEGGEPGVETYEEAERREKIAKADKAELELAKSARLVVPIAEVADVVAQENARVRSRLLGIPNKVRMQVRTFFNDRAMEEEVVSTVEAEILDAMTEIREPAEMAEARVDTD